MAHTRVLGGLQFTKGSKRSLGDHRSPRIGLHAILGAELFAPKQATAGQFCHYDKAAALLSTLWNAAAMSSMSAFGPISI